MVKVHLLKIEEMGNYEGARTRYTFHELSKKGEKIVVELIHCDANSSIAKVWKKEKWIDKDLISWIAIDVYATDKNGQCWGRYNPQEINHCKINFKWILEDNRVNRDKILSEISKLAFEEV